MARSRKRKKKGKVVKMNTQKQTTSPEKYIRTKGRSLPIETCWITDHWQKSGMADIFVVRKHPRGQRSIGIYLVDLYCLGVKDTFYRFSIDDYEYKELIEKMNGQEMDFVEIDYNTVHNIIYGAIEFAEEYEFSPSKDFIKTTQYLLKEAEDVEVPFIEIPFGREGKPFVVARPEQPMTHVLQQLERVAGPGGYHYISALDFRDDFGDFEEDSGRGSGSEQGKIQEKFVQFMADVTDEIYEEKIGEEQEYDIEDFLPDDLEISFDDAEDMEEHLPFWSDVYTNLNDGNYEEATALLNTEIEKNPRERLYVTLCQIYLKTENEEMLDSTLKEATQKYPNDFSFALIEQKRRMEEDLELEVDVKELLGKYKTVSNEDFVDLSSLMISYFCDKKEVQKALAFYTAILDIEPDNLLKTEFLFLIMDTQRSILEEKGLVSPEDWKGIIDKKMASKDSEEDGEYHDFEEVST